MTDDDGDTTTDTVVVRVTPANEISVTASTAQATEAGTTAGVFTVTRTGDVSAPLNVHYTVGGAAVAGNDYVALPAATIQTGSSTSTVIVTPIDDGAFENDESVILTLSADAAHALGSPATSTVTIVSDDLPPDLVMATVTAPAIGGADADIVVTETTKNQGTGASLHRRPDSIYRPTPRWIPQISGLATAQCRRSARASPRRHRPPCTSRCQRLPARIGSLPRQTGTTRSMRAPRPTTLDSSSRSVRIWLFPRSPLRRPPRREAPSASRIRPRTRGRNCRRVDDSFLLVHEHDARCVRPGNWE